MSTVNLTKKERCMKIFVGIFETNVCGAVAWHCRCFNCGWQSKRFDSNSKVVRLAKSHGEKCAYPQTGLPAECRLEDIKVVTR
jgi:hypothetical protein